MASVSVRSRGAFTTDLFGLAHGTTYYFRAFAQNSGGSSLGTIDRQFHHARLLPTGRHEHRRATNITGTAAQVGGEVTATGGDAPTVTIYYGDNDGGTNDRQLGQLRHARRTERRLLHPSLSGLSPLTTYYFRASRRTRPGQPGRARPRVSPPSMSAN